MPSSLCRKVMGSDEGPLTPDAMTSPLHYGVVGDGWCAHRPGHGHTWNQYLGMEWEWGMVHLYSAVSNSKAVFLEVTVKRLLYLLLSLCSQRSIFFTQIMHWYQSLWALPMPPASLDLYLTFLWQLPAITSQKPSKKAPRFCLLQKRSMQNHQLRFSSIYVWSS